MFVSVKRNAAIWSKVDVSDRHALNFASDASGTHPSGAVVMNTTRRDGSGYGSGVSNTVLTSEKIAVLAPMPTASVRTATRVNPGFVRHVRSAYSKILAYRIQERGGALPSCLRTSRVRQYGIGTGVGNDRLKRAVKIVCIKMVCIPHANCEDQWLRWSLAAVRPKCSLVDLLI